MDTLTTQQLRQQANLILEYARRLDNCESESSAAANIVKAAYAADLNSAITSVTAVKTAHAQTQASYTTVLTGANNDLVFTAVPLGVIGNQLTITYVDPGGATATLGVVVAGNGRDITVNLGRAASAINTTGTLLAAAVAAAPAAAALVTVANSGADNGSGLVIAMAKQNLAGGKN